ncbi:hypothetical protein [Bacillus sp. PS06]|uniref:hypothetical protein n=1 Tax=Bacillus sp. PS06 TaxID=2764176 RepID=UPI001782C529|nr:hypothetical protein [Bacillus sp. PS06]MBD8068603.1 hypothetical protein [Bacillus sp. PS06]
MAMWGILIPVLFIVLLFMGSYTIQRFQHKKSLRLLLVVFPIILLVSTVVYYFLPTDDFVYGYDPYKAEPFGQEEYNQFYELVLDGQVENIKSIHLNDQWSFDYAGEEINVEVDYVEGAYVWFVAERKEENDGKIEVFHYKTSTFVDTINVPNVSNHYKISQVDQSLIITPPNKYKLNITAFSTDSVLTQFSTTPNSSRNGFSDIDFHGNQVIYLKVPRDLNITSTEYIEYVGEAE